MFKSLIKWNQQLEAEVLAVLANPDRASQLAPGWRQRAALQLAALSEVERHQALAFAKRYRGWRGYAVLAKLVLVFSLAAVWLHWISPQKFGLGEALVVCNALGLFTALGLVSVWFNYRRIPAPSLSSFLLIIGLATGGALVGAGVVTWLDGRSLQMLLEKIGRTLLIGGVGVGTIYATLIGLVSIWRNREYELLAAKLQMQAEQDRLARQLSEARLRLLKAQIEPHFLFNTLGAVQQLAQSESPRAADLTANLITFLRASLSDMRTEHATLRAEFDLVDAYLKVMKTRMGPRLQYQLHLPEPLAGANVPGMMVLTLVENAIKHGLEPALQGGQIDVRAQVFEKQLRVEVHDSGVGAAQPILFGVGLSNVQERLQLTYGDAGSLKISPNTPDGLIATICLPLAVSQ